MRSLTLAIVSFFLLGIAFQSYSQLFSKKYIRKNRFAPVITYGDSGMYSRGIHVDSNLVYFGSSNGSLIEFNLKTKKSRKLVKLGNKVETRDVEASRNVIFAMQSGKNGAITKVSQDESVGFVEPREWRNVFLNALDFHGDVGFVMGDPVNGYFTLYHTLDAGRTWKPCEGKVRAIEGEAGFAASGTNVYVPNDSTYMFISGGMRSNFHKSTDNGKSWTIVELPFYPSESSGAFSLCFGHDSTGVIVGGNYKQEELRMNTAYYTHDGGETWYNSMQLPGGYRSCAFYFKGVFYCCGRNGIDYSLNGEDWYPFAEGKFYALNELNGRIIATTTHGRFHYFEPVTP